MSAKQTVNYKNKCATVYKEYFLVILFVVSFGDQIVSYMNLQNFKNDYWITMKFSFSLTEKYELY